MSGVINIIQFSSTTFPNYLLYMLQLQIYVLTAQIFFIVYNNIEIKQYNKILLYMLYALGIYEEALSRYNLTNTFNLPYVSYITSFLFGYMLGPSNKHVQLKP